MRIALFLLSFTLSLAAEASLDVTLNHALLLGPYRIAASTRTSSIPLNHGFKPSRIATSARTSVIASVQRPTDKGNAVNEDERKQVIKGLKAEIICPPEHFCHLRYYLDGTVDENSPGYDEVLQEMHRLESKSRRIANCMEFKAKSHFFKRWYYHLAGPSRGGDHIEWAFNRANLDFRDLTIEDAKHHGLYVESEFASLSLNSKNDKVPPKDDTANEFEKKDLIRLEWATRWNYFFISFKKWYDELDAGIIDFTQVKHASEEAFGAYWNLIKVENKYAMLKENDAVENKDENIEIVGKMKIFMKEWEHRERGMLFYGEVSHRSVRNHPEPHPFGLDPEMSLLMDLAVEKWVEEVERDVEGDNGTD